MKAHNAISSNDRGLAYGDGVFETIAAVDGECPYLDYHIQRLIRGCERLIIALPADIHQQITRYAANTQQRCIIKLIITRGAIGRGYTPAESTPTVIFQRFDWPNSPVEYSTVGIHATWLDFRLAYQPALADIKHLNRLEQVLASQELAQTEQYAEGLLLNNSDEVIGGTKTNLFIIQQTADNCLQLATPTIESSGIAGTMRAVVIDIAKKMAIPVQIQSLSRYDVEQAVGWFVTNAIIGLWPIQKLEQKTVSAGSMALMHRLQAQLHPKLWPNPNVTPA